MFKIADDLALVQSVDIIAPVVDEPYIFGQIAAANSLSDIFAMGANATTALNILCFNQEIFSPELAAEIMAGGESKIRECGAALVGGHSISSAEIFYGLSVTGVLRGQSFYANNTAKIGDLLILTKPLGIGVAATALKAGMISPSLKKVAINTMTQLNFYALAALKGLEVSAATDITGFGLLGHLSEMWRDEISFSINPDSICFLKESQELASMGLIPAGAYKNMDFVSKAVGGLDSLSFEPLLLSDPQTSGGLLLAISQKDAHKALENLKNAGYERAAIIGEVCPKRAGQAHKIELKCK